MITVAVAGGSGKLGRTIVEVLTANPKYRTIALSRKVRAPKRLGLQSTGCPKSIG